MAKKKKLTKGTVIKNVIWWVIAIVVVLTAASGKDTFLHSLFGKEEIPPVVSSDLHIHFIDVGQGDCIFLENQGKYLLIDAGDTDCGDIVTDYLKQLGIQTIDYVVATHPHADHIGGLPEVYEAFTVKNTFLSAGTSDSTISVRFLETLAQEEECAVYYPSDMAFQFSYTLGEATFSFVTPNATYSDLNDYSVGIRVTFGSNSFLFYGDGGVETEERMIATGADLSADLLKVSHHGSTSATSDLLLRAVDPTYAVIMCGAGNSYGHPHAETIAKLEDDDVLIYRTDLLGTIIAVSDGKQITFSTSSGVISQ